MKGHLFNFLLLLVVGSCLYLTLTGETASTQTIAIPQAIVTHPPSPTLPPLEAYRQDRQASRRETLSALEKLLSSENADLQQAAQQELLQITACGERETQVEGILSGMGYANSICIAQEDSITLFTGEQVQEKHIAALLQAAAQAAGVPSEKVYLMVP